MHESVCVFEYTAVMTGISLSYIVKIRLSRNVDTAEMHGISLLYIVKISLSISLSIYACA